MFVSKRRYNDLVIKNTINADRGDRYYAKWLHEIDMYKSAKRAAEGAEKVLAHTEQHLRSAENALHEKDEKIQRQARELQAKDQKIVAQNKQIRGLKVQVSNLERRAARAGMAAAAEKRGGLEAFISNSERSQRRVSVNDIDMALKMADKPGRWVVDYRVDCPCPVCKKG